MVSLETGKVSEPLCKKNIAEMTGFQWCNSRGTISRKRSCGEKKIERNGLKERRKKETLWELWQKGKMNVMRFLDDFSKNLLE